MNKLIAACAVVLTVSAFAEQAAQKPVVKKNGATAMARLRDPNGPAGGFHVKPGSLQGSIGFLNAQTRFPTSELARVVTTMQQMMKHAFVVKDVPKPNGLPTRGDVDKAGVSVAVFAVDDPALPALLAAPEERWALVNVAKLGEGLKDDGPGRALLAGRFRGELQRGIMLSCGGWASMNKGNMSLITNVKDLDSLRPDDLMGDIAQRYFNYLPHIGVTPAREAPYRMACMAGWAPEPKTPSQKKIWDDVHAMPKNPIVIEPEKAKK